jgi:hypothetical protein
MYLLNLKFAVCDVLINNHNKRTPPACGTLPACGEGWGGVLHQLWVMPGYDITHSLPENKTLRLQPKRRLGRKYVVRA